MNLHQLFKEVPSLDFLNRLLACYGVKGLNDVSEFCKHTLHEHNTVARLYKLLPDMIIYYIPCKAKKFLQDIDDDRAITILRQFLRLFEYELVKKERMVQKRKTIYYSVQPLNARSVQIQKINDVITLD